MSILWTAPLALAGLVLIALPIAVHLFARQPVRTLRFPSLRFLQETQLAAFRRRRIEDAVLLACRAAIVAVAAAALAGPIVQTAARTAAHAQRTSRAIVIVGAEDALGTEGAAGAGGAVFRAARFQRARVADAVADAARWLDAQPPSAREVVVTGALRRGAIDPVDLSILPPHVGIRFEATPISTSEIAAASILALRDGRLMRVTQSLRLTAETTAVADGEAVAVAANLVTISARPADAPLAEAALRAALTAGVPWRDFDQHVAIVWPGGDEFGATAREPNVRVIRMPVPVPAPAAADAVMAVLRSASVPLREEPEGISQQQLDAWSRPPGPPPADAPIADEGDRRWFWGLALALLLFEAWLRRRRGRAAGAGTALESEARVA